MDTSETYIRMCEKAEEIQTLRDLGRDGDFYYGEIDSLVYKPMPKRVFVNCHDEFEQYANESLAELTKGAIWLPRQDQLQEMVKEWDTPASLFLHGVPTLSSDEYWTEEDTKTECYYRALTSWEQLWLAFVMKRCYNKIWSIDKEGWIKDE